MSRISPITEAMTPDEILRMYKERQSSTTNVPSAPETEPKTEEQPSPQQTATPSAPSSETEPSSGVQQTDSNSQSDERMTVDEAWMRKWYDIFNAKYWDSKLPKNIAFETNNSSRTWGRASYSFSRKNGWCQGPLFNFKITLSNYNESPENIKKTTLLHEMIHIADYVFHPEHFVYNGRKVSRRAYDAHGPVFFLKEAERLKKDGWDIQKYVSEEEKSLSQMTSHNREILNNRISNAVAAVLVYTNYKFIVKTDMDALNSLLAHINEYWSFFQKNGLTRIDCYKAHSDWFNSQRSCRTRLRGWRCNSEEEFREKFNKWYFDEYPFKTIDIYHT